MPRVRYELAPDVCDAVKAILESGVLPHIDPKRIYCVRSRGSKGKAVARIYGMPGPWVAVLRENPGYVIEVVSEKFDGLDAEEKLRILLHELLHIPRTFSGALRPHGRLVNAKAERELLARLKRTIYYNMAKDILKQSTSRG